MLPSFDEITRALFGALLLARGDKRGLDFFERTPEGALRSFYAAVIMLPIYAVVEAIQLAGQDFTAGGPRLITVELLTYVIGWTAFPVAMIPLAKLIDRPERYFDFLPVYNWVSLVQMGIFFPVLLLTMSGVLPEGIAGGLGWIVTVALILYTWIALKSALDIGGGTAAGLVVVDLVLGLMLSGATDAMLGVSRIG
ncbi:MAG: hypothetical protein RID91_06920 [Azospirillaceae bacterium]